MTTRSEARPEWPAFSGADAGRLVLPDGSVVLVRPTVPGDAAALQQFFADLSAAARRQRFLSDIEPSDAVVASFCDSLDPATRLSLVALRQAEGSLNAVGLASYAVTNQAAEVGVAVADDMQSKGLGTALLERLAGVAATHGIERFDATALESNAAMLEVFHRSGFSLRSKTAQGVVALRLDLRLSARTVLAIDERNRLSTIASLRPLLQPARIAGAAMAAGAVILVWISFFAERC